MSWSRRRRYALRWHRYQQWSDMLTYGKEDWFMGKEYRGRYNSYWAYRRHQLINRGVPSAQLPL